MKAAGKSTAERNAGQSAAGDALTVLKLDHKQVERLFDLFRTAQSDSDKEEIAAELCERLKIHSTLEKEIFYPEARSTLDYPDAVDEAVVEHESIERLIAEIETMQPGDEMFDARMTVLDEQVRHHFREEQEEIFHPLRASGMDLQALGKRIQARRRELQRELAGIPVVHGPPRQP